MRLAVVSDIHGNLSALEAVADSLANDHPDLVVHAGDLVVTGPRPAAVVNRIRTLGWMGVVGNTDEMLWNDAARVAQFQRAPKIRDWLAVLFDTLAPWAKDRLSIEDLNWMRTLARVQRIGRIVVMHASPHDLWRAPMPDASDSEFSTIYGKLDADILVYGHVHRPFVRSLGALTVVNCGSVALPYDGDWRPSYALIENGAAHIRRVEYDLDGEQRAIRDSGFPLAEWLTVVQRQGKFSRPANSRIVGGTPATG